MPDDESRYLYERLDSGEFQQLVSALLADKYPDFRAFPIGQADGGRDGVLKAHGPENVIVFQDKWTKREKDPVTWLKQAIEGEKDKITALAAAGVKKYKIITCLHGTSKPGSGQMDKMDAALRKYESDLGMEEMECIWRPTLNAWVAGAPTEITWAFADMLAGWDLIRYLISEHIGTERVTQTRHLIRKLAEVTWEDDERLKFSQLDIDRRRVASLFVDVGATRLSAPAASTRNVEIPPIRDTGDEKQASITQHLLRTNYPMALVLGAPGQGKSTLTQYLCQSLRAKFVSDKVDKSGLFSVRDEEIRFPIRIELGTYAAWYEGEDVFDEDKPQGKRKNLKSGSIEAFLAESFARATGDANVNPQAVDELLRVVPSVVVFDGLDEVGNVESRKRVVNQIERFCAAGRAYDTVPRILVTSRPNASDLPEPTPDKFEVLSLQPFTDAQIQIYINKWCAANEIKGAAVRHVRKAFRERAKEAYVGELAANPMQLTILLDLLNRDGRAAPTQRTDLYDSYVELLLIREANKHPDVVRNHKDDLRDIVPFIGWYIQSRSEEAGLSGRMSKVEIQKAIEHFQATYDKPTMIVSALLDAATDRLWALTSKEQGTYEFDILSLREYFAAQFLYRFAGEEDAHFDKTDVLRELLRRPFWFNTARFYGGNADTTELYVIASGIAAALAAEPDRQTIIAAWTLLTDGVFRGRPKQTNQVLEAFLVDEHLGSLLSALHNSQIVPVPSFPSESVATNPSWNRITRMIASRPDDHFNLSRIDAIHELLQLEKEFATWWLAELTSAVGTDRELAWLRMGARYSSGTGHVDDDLLERLNLDAPGSAAALLATGLVPSPGSDIEARLLEEVLDGQAPMIATSRSMPAAVAVALSPAAFLSHSANSFNPDDDLATRRRTEALRRLRQVGSPYEAIAKQRAFGSGQQGSTFPWSNTATALFDEAGHCWLASEIAIIGAAHPHNTGIRVFNGTTAFGAHHHPATLLSEIRKNASDSDYWRAELEQAADDLTRAEWALALWAVGTSDVLNELLPLWEATVIDLPPKRRWSLMAGVEILAASTVLRSRTITAEATSDEVRSMIDFRVNGTVTVTTSVKPQPEALPSLAEIAREGGWLQVDLSAKGSYR